MQKIDIEKYNKTLGKYIKRVRESKGISQMSLSQNLITQSLLSQLENNGKNVNKLLLNRLAQRLGIDTQSFADFGNLYEKKLTNIWINPPEHIKEMRKEKHLDRDIL